jgi:hypothetical protein
MPNEDDFGVAVLLDEHAIHEVLADADTVRPWDRPAT